MVERLLTFLRGLDEYLQLAAYLLLPDIFIELLGRSARSRASSCGEAGVAEMMRAAVRSSFWIMPWMIT
jgi:hypothetical protein